MLSSLKCFPIRVPSFFVFSAFQICRHLLPPDQRFFWALSNNSHHNARSHHHHYHHHHHRHHHHHHPPWRRLLLIIIKNYLVWRHKFVFEKGILVTLMLVFFVLNVQVDWQSTFPHNSFCMWWKCLWILNEIGGVVLMLVLNVLKVVRRLMMGTDFFLTMGQISYSDSQSNLSLHIGQIREWIKGSLKT